MADPPTGTVTFLFTDIEGSTRLWERHPEAMKAALARHDEILRNAVESQGGYVFKTVGDAFCVAFPAAPDALEASLEAQRALLSGRRETIGPLRVRMALHTGSADERNGDYFGPSVNRVARLLSAGHGGQILISSATQRLVRDALPEGEYLRDLGERRLKDLSGSEHVFQAVSKGLPSSFPPLRTLDARLNNLPAQPTPLVGRERELAEVCSVLRREEVRLLTLTGPGGTGKTRLGLQAAAELLDEFEDGAFFVALAPIVEPAFVASAIAEPLGVVETGDRPLEESLKDYLRGKEVLLLLDNFEQVLESAPLVGELVSACPALKILVTSRSVLRVYGEREYPVEPLELPDPGRLPPLQRVEDYAAVRLFVERARAARPEFSVTDENAPAVAEICARLDGLPLAIELAAARVKLLPPRAMLERLYDRLRLLGGGARDLPERQRTLRGAIEWSYALLDRGERMLFARLAVFSGGCSLEAVEAVCDAGRDLPPDAMEGVSSLLDKSLLRREEGPKDEPRFVMLETIHEYASERLRESGESEWFRRLHARYFLAVAEAAEPELTGPEQLVWFERLEAEQLNMRAALSFALEAEPETARRLARALARFWEMRSYFSEGSRWLEAALRRSGASASARADALTEAAMFAWRRGDYDQAAALHGEALALSRELGDERGIGFALNSLGSQELEKGNYERATPLFDEALALSRKLGDKRTVGYALRNLGEVARQRGQYGHAATLGMESLSFFREVADEWHVAHTLAWLGRITLYTSDDLEAAVRFFEEGLAVARRLEDAECVTLCLEGLADSAGARSQGVRSARLYGATEALREAADAPLPPVDRPDHDHRVAAARAQLDEAAWRTAWSEGKSMSLEEAVEYALGQDEMAGR
jgi:predicted ATPase/class 3 adenylate cyclase